MQRNRVFATCGVWICCWLAGCETPFKPIEANELLKQSVTTAIQRELTDLPSPEADQMQVTTQPPALVEEALASRRAELDEIGPGTGKRPVKYEMGPDLTGEAQQETEISLADAIRSAVDRNLAIQSAKLQPAISAQDVIAAEAVFDALLVADFGFDKTDEPSTVPNIMGVPIGTGFNANERFLYSTGLSKLTTLGTTFSISTDLTRSQNNSQGISLVPDPAYLSAVRLGMSQPLLRGFGETVNTATIRLASNAEQRDVEQLRSDLLGVVAETEAAYWNLVLAWETLAISQWLVEVGEEVRDVLDRRREFDTKPAQYADAVATVEQRKGNVILARRVIRGASDDLKALINDPATTIGSETLLKPVDHLIESPLEYSLRDTIMTAVTNRPEVQQAVLSISDAQIRQEVADNLRLPLLNLSAEIAYTGLDDDPGTSYQNLNDGDFIDYVLGLNFEYPLGNRQAEAEYQRARLERTSSLVGYWNTVQQVVLDVKRSLRDVITNYELIEARRSYRVAQAENLRALLVDEETLASLTPEFLNLKFQQQDGLAQARLQELRALVDFDQSVARLYKSMGTGLKMKRIKFEMADPNANPDSLLPH